MKAAERARLEERLHEELVRQRKAPPLTREQAALLARLRAASEVGIYGSLQPSHAGRAQPLSKRGPRRALNQ